MTDHDQAAWTAAAHANRGNATYPPRAAQFSWEDCAAIANALVANVGQGEVWRDHNGDIVGEPIALARIAAAALADAGWTPPAVTHPSAKEAS